MELFIPSKIHKDDVYGQGFGKPEAIRLIIAVLLGAAIGLAVGLCITRDASTVFVAIVAGGFIFGAISYYFFKKNSVNLSIYDHILIFFHFLREQQYYPYQKLKEWS